MTAPLPVSVTPRRGESLESWLEHLAAVNGLTTASLLNAIRDDRGRAATRYLTLAPDPITLTRIAFLARVPKAAVQATCVSSHDRLAVDLDGLDPTDQFSYRQVAARGWTPAHGTQLCPPCLAETGVWQNRWRLPHVTACLTHRTFLVATCPGCGRPFRDQRHSHLRPVGPVSVCGNPLGAGPTRHCQHDLLSIHVRKAPKVVLTSQARIEHGLSRETVSVLGADTDPAQYLADLRHLTTLFLHLAGQSGAEHLAGWVTALADEAAARTRARGPRWGMRPPDNPAVRGSVLATADAILAMPDLDTAATVLVPWLALTPSTPEGVLGWLTDHTVMTPTLTRLVMAARAPHRRLSHHLDTGSPSDRLPTEYVPQIIPTALARAHLAGSCYRSDLIVRAFASVCLARSAPENATWADAADALGLPDETGIRLARTCTAALTINHATWLTRLDALRTELRETPVDYRAREARIRRLATRARWFTTWCREHRPGTRRKTKRHAITWLWIHQAHAHPDHSPSWNRPPSAPDRALYRQFAQSLTESQQGALLDAARQQGDRR